MWKTSEENGLLGARILIMKIEVPKKVQTIIRTLQEHGYDAYAVGGCVRDSLLFRIPADWDITTSAKPMEVKKIFKRTVDTGLQHGTVTVLIEKEGFEVTTYRIDGEYEDSRHPKEVIFTGNLEEDLKRRDFTINAMAYNNETGLVDLFSGREDLQNKVVRCVGNPQERFTEDALRILRAVRFSAQLGFSIDEKTKEAAKELAPTLQKISAERIQTELLKLLISANPQYLKIAWELGITKVVLPEFDVMMETDIGEKTLRAFSHTNADKVERLAILFANMEETPEKSRDLSKKILRRLRFDNDTIQKVSELVFWHTCPWEEKKKAVRIVLSQCTPSLFPILLNIHRAELLAEKNPDTEKLEFLKKSRQFYEEIMENKECISIKMLAVSGKDFIEQGVEPGKRIGELLSACLKIVLENPEKNTKEYLLSCFTDN